MWAATTTEQLHWGGIKILWWKRLWTLLVVNTRRPLTSNADEIIRMKEDIEIASRLTVTGLISDTNIAEETTSFIVAEGYEILEDVSRKTGLPIKICMRHRKAGWASQPWDFTKDISNKVPHLKKFNSVFSAVWPPTVRAAFYSIYVGRKARNDMAKVVILDDVCKGCYLCASACPKKVLAPAKDKLKKRATVPLRLWTLTSVSAAQCALPCPDCAIEVLNKDYLQKRIDIFMAEKVLVKATKP